MMAKTKAKGGSVSSSSSSPDNNDAGVRSKSTEKSVSKILTKIKARHLDAAKNDVIHVLRMYRGLCPDLGNFVFDNGDERRLAAVAGTIPVEYKSRTYNIPIRIWLKADHPISAPMPFVTPTKDMLIKAGHHVDHTGRVFLRYLDKWKYPESSLIGLVQMCRSAFGELPPVFSKSYVATTSPMTFADASADRQVVVLPPASSKATTSFNNDHHHLARRQPPQESNSSTTTTTSSFRRSSSPNVRLSNCDDDVRIAEEEMRRVSLVSAVEESLKERLGEEFAKTRAEIESLHHTNLELLDNQEEIDKIAKGLDEKVSRLADETKQLVECETEMLEMIRYLDAQLPTETFLADHNSSCDKIGVGGRCKLYQQILDHHVDDLSLDDAIYMLGEALRLGRIPCDVYLKRVRNLSRKQFFARALMQKCREKAGMSGGKEEEQAA